MSKHIICILIAINIASCSKSSTIKPVDEHKLNKDIYEWEQKLYQDSCILVVALRFDAEGGEGGEVIKKSYDDYIFGLSQNVQYDRFIIRELKKERLIMELKQSESVARDEVGDTFGYQMFGMDIGLRQDRAILVKCSLVQGELHIESFEDGAFKAKQP